MARPRQFDEEQVRESLMNVFWEKGYEATSMQDLVEVTGLLKGSLYGAFGDKQQLYQIALNHYDSTRIQLGIDMLKGEGNALDKISNLFNSVIEAAGSGLFSGGCLLCNASIEMAPVDERVGNMVQKTLTRLHQAVEVAIRQDSPQISYPTAIASAVIAAYFGSRVLAKSGANLEMIRATRDQCLRLLA